MDGVLVNFSKAMEDMYGEFPDYKIKYDGKPDLIPGIFKSPEPIEGAIEAVHKLADQNNFDLFVATTSPWGILAFSAPRESIVSPCMLGAGPGHVR